LKTVLFPVIKRAQLLGAIRTLISMKKMFKKRKKGRKITRKTVADSSPVRLISLSES